MACMDGASLGANDTACASPTFSSCGAMTLTNTVSASHPSRIGSRTLRFRFARKLRSCGLHQAEGLGVEAFGGLLVLHLTVDRDPAADAVTVALRDDIGAG